MPPFSEELMARHVSPCGEWAKFREVYVASWTQELPLWDLNVKDWYNEEKKAEQKRGLKDEEPPEYKFAD